MSSPYVHSNLTQDALTGVFKNRGFESFGFLSGSELSLALEGVSTENALRYGLRSCRGAVVAALPYDTTGTPAGAFDPPEARGAGGAVLGALGWFARADWYRELVGLLAAAARDIRALGPWSKSDFGIAVNSRIPEKRLAAAAGLGPLGRNTLILDRLIGPGCVLGVLLLPFDPTVGGARINADYGPPGSECGDCDACVRACPTGAVRKEGGIRLDRCVQYWASTAQPVPGDVADLWRGNLYGCDLCLAACPRFRPDVLRPLPQGALGPGLRLDGLLDARDEELRTRLKKTALGLGWIHPSLLKRNALLAAFSYLRRWGPECLGGQTPAVLAAALGYSESEDPSLAAAARGLLKLQGVRPLSI